MNRKYLLGLILVIAAIGAVGFVVSESTGEGPTGGRVTASAPKEGVIVPGTDGKVRAFENGVYSVEPAAFGISPPLAEIPVPDEAELEELRKKPGFRTRRKQEREKRWEAERIAKGLPPLTEEDKAGFEINEQNARALKKAKPGAGDGDLIDPLLPTAEQQNAPQVMPTPSLTFDGAVSSDNAATGNDTVAPPDTNGDVGPNHYISSTNLTYKIFNKTGGLVAGPISTRALWVSLPATDPCRVENDGDPIILYDQFADRWHISQFAVPTGNFRQCVAVSVTGDPTGAYYVWSYPYPGGLFNDYPKVGVWNDAYHMTFNQFAGNTFAGLGLFSQDRPKALAGDPTAGVVYKNVATVDPNAGGALALDAEGFVPPPAGLPAVVGEWRANEFGDPIDAIRFYKWIPDFVNPANTVFTVLADTPLSAFDGRQPSGRADIEVFGTGAAPLDSIADRLMDRLVYRNLGTYDAPVNSIVGNFTVNVSGSNPTGASSFDAGIRWFELRRNGDTFSVHSEGTQAGPTGGPAPTPTPGLRLNNWMGSIAQDNQGNLALGYSQSGPGQRADIKIAGRTNNAQGTTVLNEGEALFHAATGSQLLTNGSNRWGDYSRMSVDPVDDCTFWFTQEYYGTDSGFGWRTRVGSFKFPSCTPAQKGTISGTITACSSGLPINQANVTATGGFQRLTVANGTYSMSVAPGSYSVGADKAPGFFGNSQGVVVTNGGTATANICLNGVPVIASGSTTIVTESCGIPNNLPDPGETISVSLPVTNNGGAPTANLTATLRNTGGVVQAGPAQNYGALAAGGGSATRNFTFRVQPGLSCGSSITLTWDLQDGATNFGTVARTLTSGSPVVSLTENFDGATPPALPAGWTQVQTSGTAINWVTQASTADSAPNSVFAAHAGTVNATALVSPAFNVASPTGQVSFRNNFNMEDTFDGTVLEIKIGAGPWTDILAAGGSFVAGGYTDTISTSWGSPIGGRQAWSGNSAGYITSTATLPAAANGQSVQLRWLTATDSSFNNPGQRIDSVVITAAVSCQGPCGPAEKVRADFDGDGKTDPSVYRPSEGNWYVKGSQNGFFAANWGVPGDIPLAGDLTGDGRTDLIVRRHVGNGQTPDIHVLRTDTFTYEGISWGIATDHILIGDYNDDGKDDLAAFRPADEVFYIRDAIPYRAVQFGAGTDIPFAGDFDGDGRTEVAVYRPENGYWFHATQSGSSFANFTAVSWGAPGDIPVPADYDGDGKDDIAVYRPSNGTWYIRRSIDGLFDFQSWGVSTDVPVPGRYDDDNKYDVAVYRDGVWYIKGSQSGIKVDFWGVASDVPIPRKYIP